VLFPIQRRHRPSLVVIMVFPFLVVVVTMTLPPLLLPTQTLARLVSPRRWLVQTRRRRYCCPFSATLTDPAAAPLLLRPHTSLHKGPPVHGMHGRRVPGVGGHFGAALGRGETVPGEVFD